MRYLLLISLGVLWSGFAANPPIANAQEVRSSGQFVSPERAHLLEELKKVFPDEYPYVPELDGNAQTMVLRVSAHLKQSNPGKEMRVDEIMGSFSQCLLENGKVLYREYAARFKNSLSDAELRDAVEFFNGPERAALKDFQFKLRNGTPLSEEEKEILAKASGKSFVPKFVSALVNTGSSELQAHGTNECIEKLKNNVREAGVVGLDNNPIAAEALAATPLPAPIPATALQLAQEWVSWDDIVTEIVKQSTAGHRESLLRNADIVAADKKYPGLIKAGVSAVKQHTTTTARRAQRELTAQFSDMIGKDMTLDQIGQTYGFLKSPAGIEYKKLLASFTDRAEITEDEIVRRMGAEKVMTMNAFLASPAGNVSQGLYTQFVSSAFASLGHTMQQDAQAATKVLLNAVNAHIAKVAKQTKPATPK